MNDLRISIDDDPQACIEMLVDGELNFRQRDQLLTYLDQNPDLWRRCALAFINDRTFNEAINAPPATSALQSTQPTAKPSVIDKSSATSEHRYLTKRTQLQTPTIAICLCLTLLIGVLFGRFTADENQNGAVNFTGHERIIDSYDMLVQNSLNNASIVRRMPNSLIEIENTEERAIYYVDHVIPKFLIESIVFAGHQVNIDQDVTQIDGPDGGKLTIPINILKIKKYANQNL